MPFPRRTKGFGHLLAAVAITSLFALFMTGCSDETQLVTEDRPQQVVLTQASDNCDPTTGMDSSDGSGTEVSIPETGTVNGTTYNLGKNAIFRYMNYRSIVDESSNQMVLKKKWQEAGSETTDDGIFAIYDGRYLIACSNKFGSVGDLVTFVCSDGTEFKCIIGDAKNPGDPNYSEWGHIAAGSINVIEFIVAKNPPDNPGSPDFKPEWQGLTIVKAIKYGNDTNSGNSDPADNAEDQSQAQDSSTNRVSGKSKVKDGYSIPMGLDKSGSPASTSDDDRGKGLFYLEQHMPSAVNGKHDMSHEGAEPYNDAGGGGPWGAGNADPIEEVYYVCMRWEYIEWVPDSRNFGGACGMAATGDADGEQMSWTRKQRVLVTNKKTGRSCVCAIIEAGPGPADRIGGLSPEAMYYLTDGKNNTDGYTEMESWWLDDENATLGPTVDNGTQDALEDACVGVDDADFVGSGIEGMIEWAIMICQDDRVGYNQSDRNSIKDYDKGGTDKYNCDCSALVYWSLVNGGGFSELHELCGDWAFGTSDMQRPLESVGFETHSLTNEGDLKKGDILWRDGHTAIYCGDGYIAEARHTENNGTDGGEPGDQTGDEVVYEQVSLPGSFTHYFRYQG